MKQSNTIRNPKLHFLKEIGSQWSRGNSTYKPPKTQKYQQAAMQRVETTTTETQSESDKNQVKYRKRESYHKR